jgi:hypothetical protein
LGEDGSEFCEVVWLKNRARLVDAPERAEELVCDDIAVESPRRAQPTQVACELAEEFLPTHIAQVFATCKEHACSALREERVESRSDGRALEFG